MISTSTQTLVLQEIFGTITYALIFGVVIGFVWWTLKRH